MAQACYSATVQDPAGTSGATDGSAAEEASRLKRARAGSKEDLAWVLEWLRPRLARFIGNAMGHAARRDFSVADVEQDVLGSAPDWLGRLRQDADLDEACALAIQRARWVLGKAHRRGARKIGESAVAPMGFDALAPSSVGPGPVTEADEAQHLEAMIYSLPDDLIEVVLRRRQGSTFSQIAGDLELSEDTARKRFVRAAELIRKKMSK